MAEEWLTHPIEYGHAATGRSLGSAGRQWHPQNPRANFVCKLKASLASQDLACLPSFHTLSLALFVLQFLG